DVALRQELLEPEQEELPALLEAPAVIREQPADHRVVVERARQRVGHRVCVLGAGVAYDGCLLDHVTRLAISAPASSSVRPVRSIVVTSGSFRIHVSWRFA